MIHGYTVIDAHCHIYPEKIAAPATKATSTFYDIEGHCDGTLGSLLRIGGDAGIDRFIVQSVATTPHQVASINRFISNEVRNNPEILIGLGTLHPDSDDIKRDVEELISLGLKGVKLHPDIQRFKIDDYRCLKIYELCEEKGLPILMHTGDFRYDYSNTNRLIPVLEIYSNLTVIGAHFGGWSLWEEASMELAGKKNVYVDCSSSLYALDKETAVSIIRRYGADRVLFGSDYPLFSPDEELERFMSLELTKEERRLILSENAIKLYNL